MIQVGKQGELPCVTAAQATFPAPFSIGLEYSAPARGGWTIVHVGFLVPQAHEIFICAAGCLRGVVLSAAEMGCSGRFSTVAIEEHNVLDGDMEELIIDGVTDILKRLPALPKAVLVYSSCIHHFMGCELGRCYRVLRQRFPSVDFTDCYMIPTMRKSGLTPDQIMRSRLYSLLKPAEQKQGHIAIVGNCFSLSQSSDILRLIHRSAGCVHQITECQSYEEYQQMACCSLYISTQPVARTGAQDLADRLHGKHLYLPVSYSAQEIRSSMSALAEALGTEYDGDALAEQEAMAALRDTLRVVGDSPVSIDYTATSRPAGLAVLLLQAGFRVTEIYADSFQPEEEEAFMWLKSNAPELRLYPTVHAAMRRACRERKEKTLAIGQKAAYFTDSPYFVNITENGGLYGFDAIRQIAGLMREAYLTPKDTKRLIERKGLGCESCI